MVRESVWEFRRLRTPPPEKALESGSNGAENGRFMTHWRITDYGQPDDPTPDSNSAAGIGSFGRLSSAAVALSRDVEKSLLAAGGRPLAWMGLVLHNGPIVFCRWEDRTRADLRGRFDLYSPRGESRWRDYHVRFYFWGATVEALMAAIEATEWRKTRRSRWMGQIRR